MERLVVSGFAMVLLTEEDINRVTGDMLEAPENGYCLHGIIVESQ